MRSTVADVGLFSLVRHHCIPAFVVCDVPGAAKLVAHALYRIAFCHAAHGHLSGSDVQIDRSEKPNLHTNRRNSADHYTCAVIHYGDTRF